MTGSDVQDQRAYRTRLRKPPSQRHRWHCDRADIFSVSVEVSDFGGWKELCGQKSVLKSD